MDAKEQYSMIVLDRVAPVQNNHRRRNFLKGIAIVFLVFAPFLGWCELTGDLKSSLAASRNSPMFSKAQNLGMESPGSVKTETATFAGGCFWCTQADFEKAPGVVKVVAGYTDGQKQNPTYEEVSSGTTGHVEAVQVYFDPAKITYTDLLDYFWRHVDPTDGGGQFVDRGSQYRSVIFYQNEEQKRLAEQSRGALNKSGKFDKPIVTEIIKFTKFYEAEDYHWSPAAPAPRSRLRCVSASRSSRASAA